MDETRISTFQRFVENIHKSAENNDKTINFNDSLLHAAFVFNELLGCSLRGDKTFNMFCGKFSIFRDSGKDKIKLQWDKLIANTPEEQSFKAKNNPYDLLIATLKSFMRQGGEFNLVVQREGENIQNDSLWDFMKDYYESGKFKIHQLKETLDVDHFSFTGNRYRREYSDEMKTAYFCFNDKDTTVLLGDLFTELVRLSDKVEIH